MLCLILFATGCVTTPPPNTTDYGRYPADYEDLVEQAACTLPGSSTRTVTSVTDPVRQIRDDIPGWAVWARIRESIPNLAGGLDITERDWFFLLRNGKVVLSEYPRHP